MFLVELVVEQDVVGVGDERPKIVVCVCVTILRYLHFISSLDIPIIHYLSMTHSTLRYTLYFGLCRTPFP
jgi:hypothetical protein